MTRVVPLAGFGIVDTGRDALTRWLLRRIGKQQKTVLEFANANFIVQCSDMRDEFTRPGTVVVNDGIAIDLASRLRSGSGFRENLNGTDFVPHLISALPAGARICLLGSSPVSVAGAAERFREMTEGTVVGAIDGFDSLHARTWEEINSLEPDVLLVALGNPRQEKWIAENRARLTPSLIVGVGALFDFLSGKAIRAPDLVRAMRLEWAYRLLREPRRLAKRYTLDIAHFFVIALRSPPLIERNRVQGFGLPLAKAYRTGPVNASPLEGADGCRSDA